MSNQLLLVAVLVGLLVGCSFYLGVRWERNRILQIVIRLLKQSEKTASTPKTTQLRLEYVDGAFYAYDDMCKFYGQGATKAELVAVLYKNGVDTLYTIDADSTKLLKEHDDTI